MNELHPGGVVSSIAVVEENGYLGSGLGVGRENYSVRGREENWRDLCECKSSRAPAVRLSCGWGC